MSGTDVTRDGSAATPGVGPGELRLEGRSHASWASLLGIGGR